MRVVKTLGGGGGSNSREEEIVWTDEEEEQEEGGEGGGVWVGCGAVQFWCRCGEEKVEVGE